MFCLFVGLFGSQRQKPGRWFAEVATLATWCPIYIFWLWPVYTNHTTAKIAWHARKKATIKTDWNYQIALQTQKKRPRFCVAQTTPAICCDVPAWSILFASSFSIETNSVIANYCKTAVLLSFLQLTRSSKQTVSAMYHSFYGRQTPKKNCVLFIPFPSSGRWKKQSLVTAFFLPHLPPPPPSKLDFQFCIQS